MAGTQAGLPELVTALRIAIVGCGDISQRYGRTLAPHETVEIAGATDLLPERAKLFVDEFGGRTYDSLDDVLEDADVDVVVNLTIHQAHKEVIERSLLAGKHVFSEKPLTIDPVEGADLVRLASERGVRLACAPITFLGEAQQSAWKVIREGSLGRVRLAYAEVNWGRPELWHGNAKPFYEVGPVFDVAVYPLTILTAIFGPARRVTASGKVLMPDRTTPTGESFEVTTPDFAVAYIEWDDGTVARVTANFYVTYFSRQQGSIEFHGDEASLYLASWTNFDSKLERAPYGGRYEPVELAKEPFAGCEWGRGVAEMAEAIENGRPHRATGEQAAHVVEIASSIYASIRDQRPVELSTTFTPPAPMDWAV
jgi:predicted dehydrogenase